ncbi:acyl-CoA carboxylase subunit epsilon [Streptomyces sp. NPDC050422]|uniref:acyl-CoA carboxylase subunit epsilon n=1 Tax=Streptomyces sp. NPDC050422 TaxID=3365614 RepID=UPI0037A11D14
MNDSRTAPFLRVLSGTPDQAELAAVVTALLTVARAAGEPVLPPVVAAPAWSITEGTGRPEVSWATGSARPAARIDEGGTT